MNNANNNFAIPATYRYELYGLSALLVIVCHIDGAGCDLSFGNPWLIWFGKFCARGDLGVDIFLFLSGLSLFYSWHKSPDLYSYITKRFKRLVPSVLLVGGLFWLLKFLTGAWRWQFVLFNALMVPPLFAHSASELWFVGAIVLLYLAYPYIHFFIYGEEPSGSRGEPELLIRTTVLVLGVLIYVWMTHKYDLRLYEKMDLFMGRPIAFILGCYVGHLSFCAVKLPWLVGPACLVGYFFFATLGMDVVRTLWEAWCIMPLGGILASFGFAWLFDLLSGSAALDKVLLKPLRFLGQISLELYIAHVLIFFSGLFLQINGNVAVALLYAAVSIPIAYAGHKAAPFVVALFLKGWLWLQNLAATHDLRLARLTSPTGLLSGICTFVNARGKAIYWFLAILIVAYHALSFDIDWSFGHECLAFLNVFCAAGEFVPDIFIFLSGIALYSVWRKSSSVGAFIKMRLVKVAFPVFLIGGGGVLACSSVYGQDYLAGSYF